MKKMINYEKFRELPLKERMDIYKNNPDFVRNNIRGNLEEIYLDYILSGSSEEKFRKEIFEIGYVDYAASTRENMFSKLSRIEQLRTDRSIGRGRNNRTYQSNTSQFDEIQDHLMMVFAKNINPDLFIISSESSRLILENSFARSAMKSEMVRNYCNEHDLSTQDLAYFFKTILRLNDKSLKLKYNRICSQKGFKKASASKFIPKIQVEDHAIITMLSNDLERTYGITLLETKIKEIVGKVGAITIAMENLSSELAMLGVIPKQDSNLFMQSLKSLSFDFTNQKNIN